MFGHGSGRSSSGAKRSESRSAKPFRTLLTRFVVAWLILVCSGVPIPELHCHGLETDLPTGSSVLATHLAVEHHSDLEAGWIHCHVDPADILSFGLQRKSDHDSDGNSNASLGAVIIAPVAGEHCLSLAMECCFRLESDCDLRDSQKLLSTDRSPWSRLRSVLATYLPSLSVRQLLQVATC